MVEVEVVVSPRVGTGRLVRVGLGSGHMVVVGGVAVEGGSVVVACG